MYLCEVTALHPSPSRVDSVRSKAALIVRDRDQLSDCIDRLTTESLHLAACADQLSDLLKTDDTEATRGARRRYDLARGKYFRELHELCEAASALIVACVGRSDLAIDAAGIGITEDDRRNIFRLATAARGFTSDAIDPRIRQIPLLDPDGLLT